MMSRETQCDKEQNHKKFGVIFSVLPFAVFMAVMIFWHVLMRDENADAVIFAKELKQVGSLGKMLVSRYWDWTSRLLVEAVLYPISGHPLLWKICDVLMYGLMAGSLMRLLHFKNIWLTLGLWLFYPVAELSTAGWIATTLVYLWPLAAVTYTMLGLEQTYREEGIKAWQWITYSLACLFATNVEQVDILSLCVLAYFGIAYYLVRGGRKNLRFYITQCVIALGNLAFILTCPGNLRRKELEGRWMQDFDTMSILDKGVLGVTDTIHMLTRDHYFLERRNKIFLIFCVALFACMVLQRWYEREKENRLQSAALCAVAAIPMMYTAGLPLLQRVLRRCGFAVPDLFPVTAKTDAANWQEPAQYLPFVVYMIVILAIVVTLLQMFDDAQKNVELAVIFMVGLITRVMMGFSPTLYASSTRTFLFFEAMQIFCVARLYEYSEPARRRLPRWTGILKVIFLLLAAREVWFHTLAVLQVSAIR